MSNYKKPLPQMTEISKVFWDAAKNHKLLYQHCEKCGENIFYPKRICPECLSSELEWVKSKGKGKIYSHTLSISNVAPGFEEDAPYIVAAVDLDEGVRMLTNIVECDYEDIHCDMPVEVVFDDVTEEITLPKFKPTG